MNRRQAKKLILTTLATSVLLAAGTTQAGDRGYRDGYGRHHTYSQQRHYRHAPPRYYRQAYHHHDHGRQALRGGLKVAAGAVIIGSIIHTINEDRRDRVVYRTRSIAPRSDLYYRIDPDGQCVEVSHNQSGQEVWTYVDPNYCQ